MFQHTILTFTCRIRTSRPTPSPTTELPGSLCPHVHHLPGPQHPLGDQHHQARGFQRVLHTPREESSPDNRIIQSRHQLRLFMITADSRDCRIFSHKDSLSTHQSTNRYFSNLNKRNINTKITKMFARVKRIPMAEVPKNNFCCRKKLTL